MRSYLALLLLEAVCGLQTAKSAFLGRVGKNETEIKDQDTDYKTLQDEIDELHEILKAEFAENEDTVAEIGNMANKSEEKLETAYASSEEQIADVQHTELEGKAGKNGTIDVIAEDMKEQAEVTDSARKEMERITRLATDKLNKMSERTDRMIERYRHIASETEEMMVTNEHLHTNLTRQSDAIHVAHETLHASMSSIKEADEILAGGLDYHTEYEAARNAPSASYVLAAGAIAMLFA